MFFFWRATLDVAIFWGMSTPIAVPQNIWHSRERKDVAKIRIFNSNVKSVFYGAETWRILKNTIRRVHTSINCLRRILKIYWPDKISDEDLWMRMYQTSETRSLHRQTGSNLKPTREEDWSPAQQCLAEGTPGRHQGHQTQLVGD